MTWFKRCWIDPEIFFFGKRRWSTLFIKTSRSVPHHYALLSSWSSSLLSPLFWPSFKMPTHSQVLQSLLEWQLPSRPNSTCSAFWSKRMMESLETTCAPIAAMYSQRDPQHGPSCRYVDRTCEIILAADCLSCLAHFHICLFTWQQNDYSCPPCGAPKYRFKKVPKGSASGKVEVKKSWF